MDGLRRRRVMIRLFHCFQKRYSIVEFEIFHLLIYCLSRRENRQEISITVIDVVRKLRRDVNYMSKNKYIFQFIDTVMIDVH